MSKNTFKVTYHVEDGFVGKSRPHVFTVDSGEIEDDMTAEDVVALLDELVQNDFEQNITPYPANGTEFVDWAMDVIRARGEASD